MASSNAALKFLMTAAGFGISGAAKEVEKEKRTMNNRNEARMGIKLFLFLHNPDNSAA